MKWVSPYNPETKQERSVWKTQNSPSPTKALVRTSAKKLMFIVFLDIKGVILSHAAPSGKMVTAIYYSKVQHLIFYTFLLCPYHYQMEGVHIVSQLSICTYVLSIHNKNGFCSISFQKISVLDSDFIHGYIIIKCKASSI